MEWTKPFICCARPISSRDDEVLVVTPTFSMYEIYAGATGARVIPVQCEGDFRFPLAKVLDSITPATRLIAVASPNNPTGAVAGREELLQIADAAPDAALLVDEAYFEFHGETVIRDVDRYAESIRRANVLQGLRAGGLAHRHSRRAAASRCRRCAGYRRPIALMPWHSRCCLSRWRTAIIQLLCCASEERTRARGQLS